MGNDANLAAALKRAAHVVITTDGAEAIIIGGGPLAAAAKELRGRLAVPVLEPIPAAVRRLHHQLHAT